MSQYAHDASYTRQALGSKHADSDQEHPHHDSAQQYPGASSMHNFDPVQDSYYHTYHEGEAPTPPPQYDGRGYRQPQPYRATDQNVSAHQRHVHNTVTPGADNFSESAAGGVAGIAYGVAERNARESGLDAMSTSRLPPPPSHAHLANLQRNTYRDPIQSDHAPRDPNDGLGPLGLPAALPSSRSPSRSPHVVDPYAADDRYQLYSSTGRNNDSNLGMVDPNDIMDDGDDGLDYTRPSQRNSVMSASSSGRGHKAAVGGVASVGAAASTGGAVNHVLGRHAHDDNGGGRLAEYDLSTGQEKSPDWVAKKKSRRRMWKWIIILAIFLVIAGAIVGGVVGGLVAGSRDGGKSGGSSGRGNSAAGGRGGGGGGGRGGGANGADLNINSPEIQSLLNNKDLHKVFPGVDYTPLNTQYPACLADPPLQSNITKDVAVLSQLTNKIRLYGTDCNQTEMVLHAISQLEMTDTIKVWLGVWQDNNATTNARQLDQMWEILDNYGPDPFEGIIVANEALFREQFTVATLGSLLNEVRANVTAKKFNLPVATSDLGDDWTAALAAESDCIMANVHPFFSGTPSDKAAAWTYDFWANHDGLFWKSDSAKNIISETGWPTGGGTDCGSASSCTNGAVAGIDELNEFMNDWVCQALANGTNYFWFEAFDEPWKVQYNTPGKQWEDKWGLMDADRKLKTGVKIPDCGGKTVP